MFRYDHHHQRSRTLIVAAAALAPALLLPPVAHAASAQPSRPSAIAAVAGRPWIVSLGDSYMSGEAGRWAGNTRGPSGAIDALGPKAYDDNPAHTGELIPGCHRSSSAEIHIGGGVNSLNLACSGARTSTFTDSDHEFKPGLDFYKSGGRQGQALMLEQFAKTHHVTMVAVSIGGNDFGFGDIVQSCVEDFLKSTFLHDFYCKNDSSVTKRFSASNIALVTSHIAQGLRNVRDAMALAGYADSSYRILVQNYPAPLPHGSAFRYSQSGYARLLTGDCAIWNRDADWALDQALPKISASVFNAAARSGLRNIVRLDIGSAFDQRRLCQNTVGLVGVKGLGKWADRGAVDKSEWINAIRIIVVHAPFSLQESLHPDYWGQLALRNCVRQAYGHGAIHGGKCTMSGTGRNAYGEPNMLLHS